MGNQRSRPAYGANDYRNYFSGHQNGTVIGAYGSAYGNHMRQCSRGIFSRLFNSKPDQYHRRMNDCHNNYVQRNPGTFGNFGGKRRTKRRRGRKAKRGKTAKRKGRKTRGRRGRGHKKTKGRKRRR